MLNGVLLTQTMLMASIKAEAAGEGEQEDPVLSLCNDILGKLPAAFDVEAVSEIYPVMYTNSMNTVLRQEMIRYNKCHSLMDPLLK